MTATFDELLAAVLRLEARVAGETRYLSPRSLARRWDCSRSSAYSMLQDMHRRGLYSGIRVGRDQRVAVAAVEAFERVLQREGAPSALTPGVRSAPRAPGRAPRATRRRP